MLVLQIYRSTIGLSHNMSDKYKEPSSLIIELFLKLPLNLGITSNNVTELEVVKYGIILA